jgi:hypothetical protein
MRFGRHGPASLAVEYPFEHCWDDFLLGCILWYPAYVMAHTLGLPALRDDPDVELRLEGCVNILESCLLPEASQFATDRTLEPHVSRYRRTIPRYVALVGELGLMTEVLDRLETM